jgi:hypothetical protein
MSKPTAGMVVCVGHKPLKGGRCTASCDMLITCLLHIMDVQSNIVQCVGSAAAASMTANL